ncbi:RagB/SusD family nutrient uptake outer membrane protein [Marinoscillum furvescens]|nr:RagB/SusD family nutrient uptake outer membrane protein [Marinoscillum furvescens]
MKKILYMSLALIMLSACDEEFFEPKYDNERTLEQTVNDPARVEGMLLRAYSLMPSSPDAYGGFLDCATQNAVTNNLTNNLNKTLAERWERISNPVDIGGWTISYRAIQAVHNFLELGIDSNFTFWKGKSESDSTINATIRQRLEGESYFLRGYWYFNLLKRFAGVDASGEMMGVPLILEVQDANDYELLERNTFDEVVNQIVADLNQAATLLPEAYTPGDDFALGYNFNYGRATSVAANALLSRVYLYAGSALYNEGRVDEDMMAKAADAAAAALEVLGTSLPNIYDDGGEAFYTDSENDEVILRKLGGINNAIERNEFPPTYLGGGRTNPTQNLVDAFPLANGYPTDDPLSGYDVDQPYAGRNARFNATILYDGQAFKGSVIETFVDGKDYPGGSDAATVNNSTRTGYYLRKWVAAAADLNTNSNARHYFPLIRKGELMLNYAEAALEAYGAHNDPNGLGLTAYQALAEIRRRAGISNDEYLAVAANDEFTLRQIIRNERRVELCFEGHYFYDIRRWGGDLEDLNETINRIVITKDQLGDKSYSVEPLVTPQFEAHMRFGPMPFNESIKTPTISQNQGW